MLQIGGHYILSKIIIVLLCVLAFASLSFWTYHKIRSAYEAKKYPSPYETVTVDSKNISLRVQGNGKHTIVLLPGLGTTAPILDFEPLATSLAENNRVITIEPFGYGWSDLTDSPRTVENEVSEIRTALQNANIEGPYILMVHSISGLDAIYYANAYPDEVAAVVGIDCTLPRMPEYFQEELPEKEPSIIGHLCDIGITRLICMLDPSNFTSDNTMGIYSQENLYNQKLLACRMADNSTVVDQLNHIEENITATHDYDFAQDIPLLFFTTDGSQQEPRTDHKTSKTFYESYINNPSIQSVVCFDAQHYMHWTKAKEIASETESFIESNLE